MNTQELNKLEELNPKSNRGVIKVTIICTK